MNFSQFELSIVGVEDKRTKRQIEDNIINAQSERIVSIMEKEEESNLKKKLKLKGELKERVRLKEKLKLKKQLEATKIRRDAIRQAIIGGRRDYSKLGKEHGYASGSVPNKIAKELGYVKSKDDREAGKPYDDELLRAHRNGGKLRQNHLAKKYGVHRSTIKRRAKKLGVYDSFLKNKTSMREMRALKTLHVKHYSDAVGVFFVPENIEVIREIVNAGRTNIMDMIE